MITLEDTKSSNGGWSKAQLALLGVPWPPVKGWKEQIQPSQEILAQVLALRDAHLPVTT